LLARWPLAAIHGQRADRPHKPDPDALRGIAAELGVDVSACVMIGDSEVDVATARAAGAPSIGVSWGLRPLAVLTDAQPDHLVHTPAELASLFGA
jgi:phosphoglycolate phosphatase